jgi:glycosyltransferase involved in cell wall biosynthesis
MSRRPKLLFVGAFPPPHRRVFGGNVTDCRCLLGSSLPQRVELELLDTTQITNPPPSLPVRLFLAMRRVGVFLWRFERTRPDAVLLLTAVGASVAEKGAMAWYSRLRGVPALMFPRAGGLMDDVRRSRFTRWWVRLAMRGAARVLCQGEGWRSFAIEGLGREPGDAPVVQSWTATPELIEVGRGRVQPEPGAPVRLLFVGWLEREKGVRELVEACARLEGGRPFTLTLVGEGRLSEAARRQAEELGIAGAVRFTGWMQPEELVEAYRDADVFVLPSWLEGLPNAMIEAMAARLAVVVSIVGEVPTVIRDGVNGLLVSPRDPAQLTRALARVIEDDALRGRLADAGHEMAVESFGVEPAVDRLVEIIRATTMNGSSAPLVEHAP